MGKRTLRLLGTVAVAGCCGIMLATCDKKGPDGAPVTAKQVVARVGNEVVTTLELQNEFRRANVPAEKQKDPETIRRVLRELVVRKFLLQQAIAAKLDREPTVLLDLLRSREQVLENAFLTRAVAAKAPSKADVDRYIADNPLKFAGRKLLSVEQIGFPLGAGSQSVIEASKEAKSLDEIDQKLTSAGIPHSRQINTLNSGDIPPDLTTRSKQARRLMRSFFASAPTAYSSR